MKTPSSAIHYNPGVQQKVSIKTALIVVVAVAGVGALLIAIFH
jgi:hypothetical protein